MYALGFSHSFLSCGDKKAQVTNDRKLWQIILCNCNTGLHAEVRSVNESILLISGPKIKAYSACHSLLAQNVVMVIRTKNSIMVFSPVYTLPGMPMWIQSTHGDPHMETHGDPRMEVDWTIRVMHVHT